MERQRDRGEVQRDRSEGAVQWLRAIRRIASVASEVSGGDNQKGAGVRAQLSAPSVCHHNNGVSRDGGCVRSDSSGRRLYSTVQYTVQSNLNRERQTA